MGQGVGCIITVAFFGGWGNVPVRPSVWSLPNHAARHGRARAKLRKNGTEFVPGLFSCAIFLNNVYLYVVRYEFYPVSLGLYLKRLVEFDVTTHTRIQSRNGHGG